MTGAVIALAIVLAGLASGARLFYKLPSLPRETAQDRRAPTISVIIPARNEERNLPLLLGDLNAQTLKPLEIICVDDDSTDKTGEAALSFGARLVSLRDKPAGWTGKSRACQQGADIAEGELLLFLDADVRLDADALARLAAARQQSGCTVSVQPYHRTEHAYEQLSLMFNLIQVAANGLAMPEKYHTGLYGPLILIARSDYDRVGGHQSVRGSVTEDVTLGIRLRALGLPFRLYTGGRGVAFRMYGGGLRGLFQGWTKNVAAGAAKTPLLVFMLVFFFITSLTSVPIQLISSLLTAHYPWAALYTLLYIVWAVFLRRISGRLGRFKIWSAACYPLPLLAYLSVFAVSGFKWLFGLKVKWKGRWLDLEKKTCD